MWGSLDQSGSNTSGWWRHHLPAPLGWEISSCPRCSLECSGCCLHVSRESRVLQMMTSGIKAPRGAIASPVQSAEWGERCACWPFGVLCQDRGLNVKLPQSFKVYQFFLDRPNILNSILFLKWARFWACNPQISFHSPSKHIKAHFVGIFLRTAVRHALWLIMQIYRTHSRFPLYNGVKTLMHAHSCIYCCFTDKVTHNKWITCLKNSYTQFYSLSVCVCLYECICYASDNFLKIFQRLRMIQQAGLLSSGSFFVFQQPLFFPPNWLPPYILSVANHLLFCNHRP